MQDTKPSGQGNARKDKLFKRHKHKRNKRVRVSIGAPWKRRSMLAMSQLGHYVNRRNVQAAVSQVWPIFSVGGENKRCRRAAARGQRLCVPKALLEGVTNGRKPEAKRRATAF